MNECESTLPLPMAVHHPDGVGENHMCSDLCVLSASLLLHILQVDRAYARRLESQAMYARNST